MIGEFEDWPFLFLCPPCCIKSVTSTDLWDLAPMKKNCRNPAEENIRTTCKSTLIPQGWGWRGLRRSGQVWAEGPDQEISEVNTFALFLPQGLISFAWTLDVFSLFTKAVLYFQLRLDSYFGSFLNRTCWWLLLAPCSLCSPKERCVCLLFLNTEHFITTLTMQWGFQYLGSPRKDESTESETHRLKVQCQS